MAQKATLLRLVEEALYSGRTPEEVCADAPEMLDEVRRRWARCRQLESDLEDVFPPDSSAAGTAARRGADQEPGLPQIPGYDVEAVLGRGGMGVVYRARDQRLDRPVAIKMLLSGAYASRAELTRFLREARAVAALRHPNVVQVHDVGELDGRP